MKSNLSKLVTVQLLDLFNFNKVRYSHNKKEKHKAVMFAGLIVFVGIVFAGYSAMASYGYASIGFPEIILPVMMMASSIAILFTSIFKTNGLLFGSKDYDMLTALPIKPSVIVTSRFITLYLFDLVFTVLIMVPAAVVYAVFTVPSVIFYIYFVISLLFVPLIPLLIATIIGSVLMLVSLKFKHKTMVSTILNIVLIVGVLVGSAFMGKMDFAKIGDLSEQLLSMIYSVYPPSKLYAVVVSQLNLFAFVGFILCSLGLFLIFVSIISVFYSRINTSLTTHHADADYKLGTLKTSTPFNALYIKELKRFSSSSLYVVNVLVGIIMAILLSVSLCIIGRDSLDKMLMIPDVSQLIGKLFPLGISMLLCLTTTTSASISLEGSSFWIILSAPVSTKAIMDSKMAVSLTLMLPASIICSICGIITFGGDLLGIILMIAVPIVFSYFISYGGLFLNLKFPNFTWKNEATIIKQSAPVMLIMILNLVFTGLPIAAVAMLPQKYSNLTTAVSCVLVLIITLAIKKFVNEFKIKSII